ncbi:cytoplasmic tRNA 2-thiolation protein 2 isoform X2 [Physcomitrium patens]|uniref:Cytoplasmic tRNA 2-thiolation protein 2 n=1 Tax=Physcomitrium patens TaxID=3218 RepID=A0A7I4AS95_PHYPA|nr:cytoplasmic tRNA 2-thiolation protein 2-like isoform X2 [Physcomitrium patens]|eukprot:XP_024395576.1 cytoplasmic tRNA 2-thiolation protein 2-like isoform X2 [Physcomitrella patens]
MACESGQGCGAGQGCGTNACSSENLCSKDERVFPPNGKKSGVCAKCKEQPTSEDFELCCTCLHTNLISKFKTAVNQNSLVTPADHVLVAFSGGAASRVALEFLREIRLRQQTDLDASRGQGTRVFGLGVVFVDEAAAWSGPSLDLEHTIEEISSIILTESERPVPLHIAKLQDVFEAEGLRSSVGLDEDVGIRSSEEMLQELLRNVEDVTGKEDLVTYLRMQVLQKIAKEHGYTKLVLGVCSSRIAARSIAATAKGQGYSFSADIQYWDSRWPVTVVLPLRDVLARELDVYCRLANLKTVVNKNTLHGTDKSKSINELSREFVSLLQEQNFSREYTITRTMGKLKSFVFNTPPVGPIEMALRRRRGIETPKPETVSAANTVPDLLCPICSAPLDVRDFLHGDVEFTDKSSNNAESPSVNSKDLQEP